MREDEFKRWLKAQGYATNTINTQLSNARKTEQGYGDLDALYDRDGLAGVARQFAYTASDSKAGREPATKLTLWGDPYRDLASLRMTLSYYKRFRQGLLHTGQGLTAPDRQAVERAMDECAAVGAPAFLEAYGFSASNVQYYLQRGDELFPTKAIFAVAYGYMPNGIALDSNSINGTDAHQALAALGFEIVKKSFEAGDASPAPAAITLEGGKVGPSNIILYGPPGTGKTWRTAFEAVRLCDGSASQDREPLMDRYRELVAEKRIAFVTFHQSIDYETFVEGLRPETEKSETSGAGFRLEPQAGIFREVCKLADEARRRARRPGRSPVDLEGRRFWKMSLGAAGIEDDVYEAALAGDYIVLGWGGDVDWSDPRFESLQEVQNEWASKARSNDKPSNYTQLWPFRAQMKKGDLVIVSYGNTAFRAVAEVTGDYQYVPRPEGDYSHRRAVRWLLKLDEALPLETIVQGAFTMRSLYPIAESRVNKAALQRLLGGGTVAAEGAAEGPKAVPEAFVLIIDEINRANVAKVFGELITLIEPDKRLGQPNALEVTLPHSRLPFGVPDNLHILGAMNTADRSIALLDTALRRRFRFVEMPPEPKRLEEAARSTGEPLVEVLGAMNDRIEYLLDRDHCIGHAYLMSCRTPEELEVAFRSRIIPLLQEYFFEDWSKVAAVLGDRDEPAGRLYEGAFLRCRRLRDPTGKSGEDRLSWSVRDSFSEHAYRNLVRGVAAETLTAVVGEGPNEEAGVVESL